MTNLNDAVFDPTKTINTSGILFRMAVQSANRSASKGVSGQTNADEARYREADEFIVTVMMTHAAIEAAWHWEFMINNLEKKSWPVDFFSGEGIKVLCEKKGRAIEPAPDEVRQAVTELSAWRNFLQHGDSSSRERLTAYIGSGDFHTFMNFRNAKHMLTLGDRFFAYLTQSTGSQNVGPSALLWPGWD